MILACSCRFIHRSIDKARNQLDLFHLSNITPKEKLMIVLGIESSCDETGLALYDTEHGLLAHALHSQIAMHQEYGGVVPELASRDHIRRALPLLEEVLNTAKSIKQRSMRLPILRGQV